MHAHNVAWFMFARWVLRRDTVAASARRGGRCKAVRRVRRPGQAAKNNMGDRKARFARHDWEGLHEDYLRLASVRAPRKVSIDVMLQEVAMHYLSWNMPRRGMTALIDDAAVERDCDVAAEKLLPVHPASGALSEEARARLGHQQQAVTPVQVDTATMLWAVRTAPRLSAAGPSGWRNRHLADLLLEDETLLTLFTGWANGAFLRGSLPDELGDMWTACNTIGLRQRHAKYRPISMSDSMRRIMGRAALKANKAEIQSRLEPLQRGVFSASGCEMVIHTATLHLELYPSHVILHVDIRNALNSLGA